MEEKKQILGKKVRIGVLMGGRSLEHEVSFNSGRTVCDHLDISHYEVVPLFQVKRGEIYLLPFHFLHRGKTDDFVHRLPQEAQQVSWDDLSLHDDFIYIATHGQYAEDGRLQGMLELLHIPYLGSTVFASALRMDKVKQKTVFALHGIDYPRFYTVSAHTVETIEQDKDVLLTALHVQKLQFPLVVKPVSEGSSLGVSVVFSPDELFHAIKKASTVNHSCIGDVLIEEKIDPFTTD